MGSRYPEVRTALDSGFSLRAAPGTTLTGAGPSPAGSTNLFTAHLDPFTPNNDSRGAVTNGCRTAQLRKADCRIITVLVQSVRLPLRCSLAPYTQLARLTLRNPSVLRLWAIEPIHCYLCTQYRCHTHLVLKSHQAPIPVTCPPSSVRFFCESSQSNSPVVEPVEPVGGALFAFSTAPAGSTG